jgi:N-acetylmuramoyl-L-alanine amidase
MRFASSKGHTLRGADYGASGIKEESILVREVGYKVDEKLRSLGHEVIDCCINEASTVGESLSYRVNVANNSNADFFFEIHFNCGGGHGVEVFTYGGKEVPQARNILNNIVALGYTNRGIKDGSNLYVVRNTSMIGILIEVAFIDSQEDMDRYNTEDLANAIVKGLTGQTVTETKQDPKKPYIVCYNNEIDKRAALYLSEYLGCKAIDNSTVRMDYEPYYPICVGGGQFTSYCKKLLRGDDRFKTMKLVADFIEERR